MEQKTQEQILVDSLREVYDHPEDAKDDLVNIWDDILTAMSEWERQQNHVLRERATKLEEAADKLIKSVLSIHPTVNTGDAREMVMYHAMQELKHLLTT